MKNYATVMSTENNIISYALPKVRNGQELGNSVVDLEWFSPDPTFHVVPDPVPDPDPSFKPEELNKWLANFRVQNRTN